MGRFQISLGIIVFICGVFSQVTFADTLVSPDGHIKVDFEIGKSGALAGLPFYRVSLNGENLIGDSKLGINFQNQAPLADVVIKGREQQAGDSTYSMPFGKNSFVSDQYHEYVFHLVERASPYRALDLTFRLYNDGFGLRYSFPKQDAFTDFVITDELTSVALWKIQSFTDFRSRLILLMNGFTADLLWISGHGGII